MEMKTLVMIAYRYTRVPLLIGLGVVAVAVATLYVIKKDRK